MRAVIVSSRMPQAPGPGAATREFQLIKQLARQHEIVCVVPCWEEQDRIAAEALSRFCRVHPVYPRLEQAPQPANPGPKSKTLNRLQGSYRLLVAPPELLGGTEILLPLLAQELRKIDWESTDLFQVEHEILGGLLAGKPRRVPAVLDCYDICSAMVERRYRTAPDPKHRLYEWIEWRKVRAFERRTFQACGHVLVASDPDRARALALSPKSRVSVAPNGVDTDTFANAAPGIHEPRSLLFTGAMAYPPNVEAAAYFCRDILPAILHDFPDAVLTLAGRDPAPAILDLAGRRPGNIVVTGSVHDMRPYLERAAVCVVPLLNGGGTRLKILEALSMQKAVVTTSLGCEGIAAVDGEHLLIADTPQAFAEATKRLLADSGLREKLGRQGRTLATQKYDWRAIAPTIHQIWDELARSSRTTTARN